MKYLLILTMLLSGCGGKSSPTDILPVPVPVPEPVVNTVHIYKNENHNNISDIGNAINNGFDTVYLTTTYSQENRDIVERCGPECFKLTDSMILGDDKDCVDCLRLSVALDYLTEQGIEPYIVVSDSLSSDFAENLASMRGYNIVLTSPDNLILGDAQYNYPLALLVPSGEYEANNNIDYYIVDQSNIDKCESKCIATNITALNLVDGVNYGAIYN